MFLPFFLDLQITDMCDQIVVLVDQRTDLVLMKACGDQAGILVIVIVHILGEQTNPAGDGNGDEKQADHGADEHQNREGDKPVSHVRAVRENVALRDDGDLLIVIGIRDFPHKRKAVVRRQTCRYIGSVLLIENGGDKTAVRGTGQRIVKPQIVRDIGERIDFVRYFEQGKGGPDKQIGVCDITAEIFGEKLYGQ